jgi:hypothetical protein
MITGRDLSTPYWFSTVSFKLLAVVVPFGFVDTSAGLHIAPTPGIVLAGV